MRRHRWRSTVLPVMAAVAGMTLAAVPLAWGAVAAGRAGAEPVALDPNGVRRIYATASGGPTTWYLGYNDDGTAGEGWLDRTLDSKFEDDPDTKFLSGRTGRNVVVRAGGAVRLSVFAEHGHPCYDYPDEGGEVTTDQGLAYQRGYMCTPLDWKNVEVTGYLRLVGDADPRRRYWQVYSNGGRHPAAEPPQACTGSAYKARYDWPAREAEFVKEAFHNAYDSPLDPEQADVAHLTGDLDHTRDWLGIKYVRYQVTDSTGGDAVRLELWLDGGGVGAKGVPANHWRLALVREDHGWSWGDRYGHNAQDSCNAPDPTTEMLWGGPWVAWRWDGIVSDIRLMSIREIEPGQRLYPRR